MGTLGDAEGGQGLGRGDSGGAGTVGAGCRVTPGSGGWPEVAP